MATATEVAAPGKAMTATKAEVELAWEIVLGDKELPVADDPEVVSRAIMERIRDADTFEAAFADQTLEAWQDLEGVPVQVIGFHLNRSTVETKEGALGAYAVVDIVRLDGASPDRLTVTCGSRNVLAQLVKMLEKGWFDKPVKVVSSKTAAGYDVLRLAAA